MGKIKPIYVVSAKDAKLHLSKGNSKIGKGIWAFSTLPGNEKNLLLLNKTVLLTDVPGTCSKYCDGCFNGGCYAVNSAKLHHNAVIRAWAENTLLLRSGKLFDEIDAFIKKKNAKYYKSKDINDALVRTFRINVSGEIESLEQFEAWNELAKKNPEVKFGVYTKNFDDLAKFLDKHKESADNLCINASQWHHVADEFLKKYSGKVNVFTYDDAHRKSVELSFEDKARLGVMPHCPAVTMDGKHAKDKDGNDITCDRCGRCYRKTGKETAVYAH